MDEMRTVGCEGRVCRLTKSDLCSENDITLLHASLICLCICCATETSERNNEDYEQIHSNEDINTRNLTPLMLDRKTSMNRRII